MIAELLERPIIEFVGKGRTADAAELQQVGHVATHYQLSGSMSNRDLAGRLGLKVVQYQQGSANPLRCLFSNGRETVAIRHGEYVDVLSLFNNAAARITKIAERIE
jgi:hypothetical protein